AIECAGSDEQAVIPQLFVTAFAHQVQLAVEHVPREGSRPVFEAALQRLQAGMDRGCLAGFRSVDVRGQTAVAARRLPVDLTADARGFIDQDRLQSRASQRLRSADTRWPGTHDDDSVRQALMLPS